MFRINVRLCFSITVHFKISFLLFPSDEGLSMSDQCLMAKFKLVFKIRFKWFFSPNYSVYLHISLPILSVYAKGEIQSFFCISFFLFIISVHHLFLLFLILLYFHSFPSPPPLQSVLILLPPFRLVLDIQLFSLFLFIISIIVFLFFSLFITSAHHHLHSSLFQLHLITCIFPFIDFSFFIFLHLNFRIIIFPH